MNKSAIFLLLASLIAVSFANIQTVQVTQQIINSKPTTAVAISPPIAPPCEQPPACNIRCLNVYEPVCARNLKGQELTFTNECYLATQQCSTPDQQWTLLYKGECRNCRPFCPLIYKPVCAQRLDGELVTYGNQCELEYAQCSTPEYQLQFLYDGECRKCNPICPAIYKPVCAQNSDGKLITYSNQCELEYAQCSTPENQLQFLYEGECRVCERSCPRIFKPVCARNSTGELITYSNQCELENAQCSTPENQLQFLYEGECRVCERACPRIFKPVCARNSTGELITYSNQCELENAQCSTPENQLQFLYEGECRVCERACPRIFKPVCARNSTGDLITYSNQCELENAQCSTPENQLQFLYEGECRVCERACPRIFKPVCARNSTGDLITYSNQCELENAQCSTPENQLQFLYEGECRVCERPCPRIFKPVCAQNSDGELITYSNQCELENAQCSTPENQLQLLYEGECRVCERPCPRIFKPVCARNSDGELITYSNQCELENAQCSTPENQLQFLYEGECRVCERPCPRIFKPVCAQNSDGELMTYSNQCELENAQCSTPENQLQFLYEGECRVCERPCPRIFNPVCARNSDGELITYSNQCELENAQCSTPENQLQFLYEGECRVCERSCPRIYKPVCARKSDGELITYSNQCELDYAQCSTPEYQLQFLYEGECRVCERPCPRIFKPVCAQNSDGQLITYSNQCELENAQCSTPENQLQFLYEGECRVCERPCPRIFNPVCARNSDGELITYSNQCELENAQCSTPENQLQFLYEGECRVCERSCPRIYKPVCARKSDGELITYSNQCELDYAQCSTPEYQLQFLYEGECRVCERPCPRIFKPVCAQNSDGQLITYSNQCELENAQCSTPENQLQFLYEGECRVCERPCPRIFKPVCARNSDGELITYSNQCELENAQCSTPENQLQFLYEGECRVCERPCPRIFKPVCAQNSDGELITYSNQCELENAQCSTPENQLQFLYEGECRVCERPCPRIFKPVCARNSDGELITYSNQCELENAQCSTPENQLQFLYEGECRVCERSCPRIYKPVCARKSDGELITYSNQCELENAQCSTPENQLQFLYEGECRVCERPCPRIFKPVCARNTNGELITYSNQCELENAQCSTPKNQLQFLYEGECRTCNSTCPAIYDPVCARNRDGEVNTYGNQCQLEYAQCSNPELQLQFLYEGECGVCKRFCPKIYKPVCARKTDGELITYSNQCELDYAQCSTPEYQLQFLYEGECRTCNSTCPAIYEPVCARSHDGEVNTYGNQCQLEYAQCSNPELQLQFLYEGECRVCEPSCPKIFKPVCARKSDSELITYSNQCELDYAQCSTPEYQLQFLYEGECRTCNSTCSAIYEPVCARSHDGEVNTYGNQCQLEYAQCSNPELQLQFLYEGECGVCKRFCPRIYKPVCARKSDGELITYSNQCELDYVQCSTPEYQLQFLYEGECRVCEPSCPKIFKPVCARKSDSELITYSNQCELDYAQCSTPEYQLQFLYEGECRTCNSTCPAIYEPVCARSHDGELNTYGNQCQLEYAQCSNPELQLQFLYEGECRVCEPSCPKIFKPVCARKSDSELITYSNQCELDYAQCSTPEYQLQFLYEGECRTCNSTCSAIYEPVCARSHDGEVNTYGNQCQLEYAQCSNPELQLQLLYEGECGVCKRFCPRIYKPVCARKSDGELITYSNQCELDYAQCSTPEYQLQFLYEGECRTCNPICAEIYQPVCARRYDGELNTYGNQCELEYAQCSNPELQLQFLYKGECGVCKRSCPRIYKPVCARKSDNELITYSNQCEFEYSQCSSPEQQLQFLYEGECRRCNTICTLEYRPVCARDLKGNLRSFGNMCQFESEKCLYPEQGWTIVSDGECPLLAST